MNVANAVADALAELINGHEFTLPLTGKREYDPTFGPEEIEDLIFRTVPREEDEEAGTRTDTITELTIDVPFIQHLTLEDGQTLEDAADPLADLVQEVKDFLRFKSLTIGEGDDAQEWKWQKTDNKPIFDQTQLTKERTYYSLVTVHYTRL